MRRLISQGIDPVEQKQSDKRQRQYATENTFEVLAMEWHAAMVPRWKESSKRANDSRRVLEMYVFPKVGNRPIESILPLEWLGILRTLEDLGKFEQRRRLHAFCRDCSGQLIPNSNLRFSSATTGGMPSLNVLVVVTHQIATNVFPGLR